MIKTLLISINYLMPIRFEFVYRTIIDGYNKSSPNDAVNLDTESESICDDDSKLKLMELLYSHQQTLDSITTDYDKICNDNKCRKLDYNYNKTPDDNRCNGLKYRIEACQELIGILKDKINKCK